MAARRLRAKLQEYYGGEGCNDPVRIEIPKGSYAASFLSSPDSPAGLTLGTRASVSGKPAQNAIFESYLQLVDQVHSSLIRRRLSLRWLWVGAGIPLTLTALALWLGVFTGSNHPSSAAAVSGKLLIADVTNATGEPLFDDALKQAVAVDLSQSPLLDILSDSSIRAQLKLMSKSEIGRASCR